MLIAQIKRYRIRRIRKDDTIPLFELFYKSKNVKTHQQNTLNGKQK